MENIIPPVEKATLRRELSADRKLRMTNRSSNEIYIIDAYNAPNVLREIGRLREMAFRDAGGGTGKALDLDYFDTNENCYKQLIVWNPETEEIIGGYRYITGQDIKLSDNGQPILSTSCLFHFSERFIRDFLPQMIELGRSFVAPEYQNTRKITPKSIYALDNLWDGLGALTVIQPNVKYLFGKMTMYPSFNKRCRDMILFFLKKHFEDKEKLITPIIPLKTETDFEELKGIFKKESFKENYIILNREIRKLGYNIPPLVNAYMGLSPTMKTFGSTINDDFGNVFETGILITVDEIFEEKRIRYIDSYAKEHPEIVKIRNISGGILYKNEEI